jgi:hypothetical protein
VPAQELGEITDEAKGVLLSLVARGGDEAALGGLADGEHEECVAAWRALGRLEEGARDALLSAWRARAKAGLPDGIGGLHPSWIEAALAGEPLYLLRYLHGRVPQALRPAVEKVMTSAAAGSWDPSIGPALGREIERLAFGHLAPLCESACGPLATRLCALDFEALQTELTRTGARTLGRSLGGTDAGVRARAMALAGEPWAGVMAEAFRESISVEQRKAAIVHASANVQASARTASQRLLHLGLATIAADLVAEGEGSLLRVAGRLPADLGQQLLGRPLPAVL